MGSSLGEDDHNLGSPSIAYARGPGIGTASGKVQILPPSPTEGLDAHPIAGDQGSILEREVRAQTGTSPEQKCGRALAGPLKRRS